MFREFRTLARGNEGAMARARYGEAMALLQLGQANAAEVLLRDSIGESGTDVYAVPAILGLARVYDEAGRFDEAAQAYQRVISQSADERGAEALVRFGGMLLRQGRARQAVEELGRLQVLFGGYPAYLAQGYLVQARAFVALGATGDASRTYDILIEQFGDYPEAATAGREKSAL